LIVFVDTSAFCALLNADDQEHERITPIWAALREANAGLLTTNYVALETIAVLQNRLGLAAVRAFLDGMIPVLEIEWVHPEADQAAAEALVAANRRELSLVDCVSFAAMRRLGLRRAFTLDPHFSEQGFECLPAPIQP
jgi:predicted nucleic acid-binding protein